ncbi:MAG: ribosome-associated translation inhibitor RaiA [Pseudarcicella sp.]|jgi:putative sigma-54 modulation protein|nr:ribosome-associated translation inhibitor RaiA [Pseudarcicella sp.]MBP6409912.1 ribosome-associated translation inhibitor RaiA [Pseudarcicella sp.]
MKLQVHSVHFDADNKLLEFIQAKLNKLDTFYDKITVGEVFLRLDKGESSKTKNKLLEVKISLPGMILFVKQKAKTFEEAVDNAIEALKIQIKKFKQKLKDNKPYALKPILMTMAMDS